MKKPAIKNFSSIKDLEQNIYKTAAIITCLEGNYLIIQNLVLKNNLKEISIPNETIESLKKFSLDEKDWQYVHEIGYIGLFSNFEFFMADFSKELFLNFPESFPKDTKLDIDEISMLTSVKQIKEFIIDKAAITKSFELKAWLNFLRDNYKIKIFTDKTDEERFYFLNELRNSLMHSGGKINSKFKKFLKDNFKTKKAELNQLFTSDYKKFFDLLFNDLRLILGNLKKL